MLKDCFSGVYFYLFIPTGGARIPRSIENSNDRVNVLPMIIYIIVCSCMVLVVGISTRIYSCIKAGTINNLFNIIFNYVLSISVEELLQN